MSDSQIDWDKHSLDTIKKGISPGYLDEKFRSLPWSGKILEIGAGTCRWYKAFQWLNTLNGHKIEYYAYDSSIVAEQVAKYSFPEVRFTRKDIFELSKHYDAESFDAIFSAAFLEHFNNDNKRKILTEAYKILKPNGKFVIVEMYFENATDDYTNDRAFTVTGWHKFMTESSFSPEQIALPYLVYHKF